MTAMTSSVITGPGLEPDSFRLHHTPADRRSIEDPNTPITPAQLADLLSGGSSDSGKPVTPRGSMKVGAVFACVRVIANAIARMPLITYERTAGGRERAVNHPLYHLLKVRPNPDMSAFTLRNTIMANALLWGNGYAEIVRRRDGVPTAIYPIESERVTPFREAGELKYRVYTNGVPITLLRRDVLHLPGLSFDGLSGVSVVAHARQTIGAALSADEFSSALLRQGMRPSGVLTSPGELSPEAHLRLRESFNKTYGGAPNSGKPLILESGVTWSSSGMPLEDAQWVESSYFRIEDIARWFGVPPHKIQHLLRATNNNIEQQSLDFLGDTVAPWVEPLEQELNWKLFSAEEQERYYAEHLTQAIVQMDANARGQLYERLFRVGSISPDEIRERENLNNVPDGRGRTYWTQSSNMPLPTEQQRDELIGAWIKKGSGSAPGGAGGPSDGSGQPDPKTDGQVAGSGASA